MGALIHCQMLLLKLANYSLLSSGISVLPEKMIVLSFSLAWQ